MIRAFSELLNNKQSRFKRSKEILIILLMNHILSLGYVFLTYFPSRLYRWDSILDIQSIKPFEAALIITEPFRNVAVFHLRHIMNWPMTELYMSYSNGGWKWSADCQPLHGHEEPEVIKESRGPLPACPKIIWSQFVESLFPLPVSCMNKVRHYFSLISC